MPNYKIEFLPTAQEDLARIADWYVLTFSPASAEKVINGILDTIDRLAAFPMSGSQIPDKFLAQLGYRMVISGNFIAFYRFINDIVYIYHIADGRSEYTKLFSHKKEN